MLRPIAQEAYQVLYLAGFLVLDDCMVQNAVNFPLWLIINNLKRWLW